MYRIRFHGRGGQGMKTAACMLGSAFFRAGFEVQDAPRYGAERRGAPMTASVRAGRGSVNERGVIRRPDLVIVADETLVPVAAAGVLDGVTPHTVLLVHGATPADAWRERLHLEGPVVALPVADLAATGDPPYVGAACAGAAARLVGVVGRDAVAGAVADELADEAAETVARNRDQALAAFDALADRAGLVTEGPEPDAATASPPDWVTLPLDAVDRAAPDIHATLTSVRTPTGLWRTMRPVINLAHCHRCSWICGTFCPDGAVLVDADRTPRIDYDHCKGCLVCVAVCPHHAIGAVPERTAREVEG
jgi:pyruvate ferredoxin oxidoreductase gamma subunit